MFLALRAVSVFLLICGFEDLFIWRIDKPVNLKFEIIHFFLRTLQPKCPISSPSLW